MTVEKTIRIGTRTSPLARVQVKEILRALSRVQPGIRVRIIGLDTVGDKDKKTPISEMEGTDFFTKEIDETLLCGKIDCAVHSAKDLPDVIPEGIKVAAFTKSLDPCDVLVSRNGLKLRDLPRGARIGTSSERRKKQLLSYRPDLRLVDIRGTMQERLDKLGAENLDAIVIAGAGLIRLGLGHHITERISFKILQPHSLQGSLAVTVRTGNKEMSDLFLKLNGKKIAAASDYFHSGKKKILVTGTGTERFRGMGKLIHVPMIALRPPADQGPVDSVIGKLSRYDGIIFTSKHAVRYFLERILKKTKSVKVMKGKKIIAIGKTTARHLASYGLCAMKIAKEESAEGIVKMLRGTRLKGKRFLIPRSDLARNGMIQELRRSGAWVDTVTVYQNVPAKTRVPDLEGIDEIIFMSPSAVKNFMKRKKTIPDRIIVRAIGPVTRACLEEYGITRTVGFPEHAAEEAAHS